MPQMIKQSGGTFKNCPTMAWGLMPDLACRKDCNTGNSQQKRVKDIKYHAIITLFAISDNRAGCSHFHIPILLIPCKDGKEEREREEIAILYLIDS